MHFPFSIFFPQKLEESCFLRAEIYSRYDSCGHHSRIAVLLMLLSSALEQSIPLMRRCISCCDLMDTPQSQIISKEQKSKHQDVVSANRRISELHLQKNMKHFYTKMWSIKDKKSHGPEQSSLPPPIKCVPVDCQYQLIPADQYSLHPLPFVSQQSTDDWWPQLTASNNYQCVGKPSNRG